MSHAVPFLHSSTSSTPSFALPACRPVHVCVSRFFYTFPLKWWLPGAFPGFLQCLTLLLFWCSSAFFRFPCCPLRTRPPQSFTNISHRPLSSVQEQPIVKAHKFVAFVAATHSCAIEGAIKCWVKGTADCGRAGNRLENEEQCNDCENSAAHLIEDKLEQSGSDDGQLFVFSKWKEEEVEVK